MIVTSSDCANTIKQVLVPEVPTLPDRPQDKSANARPMSSTQVEADATMRTECLTDRIMDGGENAKDGQELSKTQRRNLKRKNKKKGEDL